jgi:quinol monooxygenase YgiN
MIVAFHRAALICSVLLLIAVSNAARTSNDHGQPKTSAATQSKQMEITIFARFHAFEGKQEAVASELRDAVARVRTEPGCLGIEVYRSVRDSRLFWLHSRWVDEAAFDKHTERPETNQFVERVQRLIDHPFDVTRTRILGPGTDANSKPAN